MNDMTQTCLDTRVIALDDAERQRCEVWSRVMGYHRPVASFNIGKKGEFHERRFFEERCAGLEGAERPQWNGAPAADPSVS